MTSIALLSNPNSTGNQSLLPQIRAFCEGHCDIFHYEVESVGQIAEALRTIARVRPRVLVINGGDGTVQAALTELYHGGHFGDSPPPVAVLPNGKTNLIAYDLGAVGDPIEALERVLDLARTDLVPHIVSRELIELTGGGRGGGADGGDAPVLGMFLGGAGLADMILYCRHKIYPLGLPNWAAHGLTFLLGLASVLVGRRSRLLPAKWAPLRVTVDGRPGPAPRSDAAAGDRAQLARDRGHSALRDLRPARARPASRRPLLARRRDPDPRPPLERDPRRRDVRSQ